MYYTDNICAEQAQIPAARLRGPDAWTRARGPSPGAAALLGGSFFPFFFFRKYLYHLLMFLKFSKCSF